MNRSRRATKEEGERAHLSPSQKIDKTTSALQCILGARRQCTNFLPLSCTRATLCIEVRILYCLICFSFSFLHTHSALIVSVHMVFE